MTYRAHSRVLQLALPGKCQMWHLNIPQIIKSIQEKKLFSSQLVAPGSSSKWTANTNPKTLPSVCITELRFPSCKRHKEGWSTTLSKWEPVCLFQIKNSKWPSHFSDYIQFPVFSSKCMKSHTCTSNTFRHHCGQILVYILIMYNTLIKRGHFICLSISLL